MARCLKLEGAQTLRVRPAPKSFARVTEVSKIGWITRLGTEHPFRGFGPAPVRAFDPTLRGAIKERFGKLLPNASRPDPVRFWDRQASNGHGSQVQVETRSRSSRTVRAANRAWKHAQRVATSVMNKA